MGNFKRRKLIADNILVITTSPFPYGSANSNLVRLLSLGLLKNGRKVKVLVQNIKRTNEIDFRGVIYKGCGVFDKSIAIINYVFTRIIGAFSPAFYVLKNRKKVDFIILFSNYVYDTLIIVTLCKILHIKTAHLQVDYYDRNSFKKSHHWSSWRVKLLSYNLRYRFLNKYNDGIIVISYFLKNHFIKLGVKEINIYKLTHLVEIENFKDARNYEIFSKQNITFGCIGPLSESNGISVLLKAFKIIINSYDNTRLIIIGGPMERVEYYKNITDRLDISANVTFTGHVNHELLSDKLYPCDAIILARPNNIYNIAGFPTKIGEILASKKLLIVSQYGDIQYYFKDEFNALLSIPDDPESIAKKMQFLIENSDIAKNISERGFIWAKNNIEYVSETKRLVIYIDNLLSRNST